MSVKCLYSDRFFILLYVPVWDYECPLLSLIRGRFGHDRMANHHWCEFESRLGRGVQHYVIKFISDLRQVDGFLQILRFPPPLKLTATIQLNLVKYCWKWRQTNQLSLIRTSLLVNDTLIKFLDHHYVLYPYINKKKYILWNTILHWRSLYIGPYTVFYILMPSKYRYLFSR